ncbi:MAG TPA: ribosome-associated translation inhibitor RaiA [Streptosporangiaceae bacterium]|nr:ribosome-associated translation inhibitor RaiA [Streptosporangiaceae bacterium]
MEITFKGRQTDVAARFRDQATAKLEKLEKLDQKTIRVDVEVSVERNPRQSSQKERVELTIISRGPAIRAEAAAEDRFAALDLALAKLDSRLRRALDRRKRHHAGRDHPAGQLVLPEDMELPAQREADSSSAESVVAIDAEGDGPLVVRQKFHQATPISIDQALLEMELVGHDFYLFHDVDSGLPSVVYRRRGYQYGVIRLVGDSGRVNGSDPSGGAAMRQRPKAPVERSG